VTYSPRQPRIFMDESRDLSKYLSIDFCLDEHSRALWLGENKTPLSMSKTSVNIEGDFNVSGNIVSHNGSITDGSGNVLGSGGGASALNDLSDVSYSSGDLTITSLDKIIADDFVVDSGASIALDSHNGRFVVANAGTEFSVANSAYAGMIIGYQMIGEQGGHETEVLTTSFAVTDANHRVKFVAPPSGKVEIEVQIYRNSITSNKFLYFGLSDNATYNSIGGTYEQLVNYADETDDIVLTHKWVVSVTAGTTYEYWLGAKTSGTNLYLNWGGSGSNRFPDFIMKATALPAATTGFAVYD